MAHVRTNGIDTHYERSGSGPPLWILHGGLEDGRSWSGLAERLGDRWTTTVPDRRGHGRTPDADGDYSYRQMTDDVVAAITQLESGPVAVIGYSDGGDIALELAVRRPDLVASVVAVSANLDAEGLEPTMLERLRRPDPDAAPLQPLRDAYAEVSPDGAEHWSTFHCKVCAMGAAGPGLTTADLGRIACPTLIVCADDDVVRLAHTVAMYDALAAGQLAVVPDASHLVPVEHPELLGRLVATFLDDPQAHRMMPMRRVPADH